MFVYQEPPTSGDQASSMAPTYETPKKAILLKEQLESFQASQTYTEIVNYILTLNQSVIGVKLTDECPASEVCPLCK